MFYSLSLLTLGTCWAPLSMRFPRQAYWSGLPFPSPGESSQTRDQICVSCTDRQILDHWEPRKPNFPCCCSVSKSCPTFCNPMDCSMPVFPVLHYPLEFVQPHVCWVSDSIQSSQLLLPLLLLPSVFPSIRDFSSESALHISWLKYWSFSFSISPSNEYSGLIPFKMDWFDLLAVHGTLKGVLQHYSSKA